MPPIAVRVPLALRIYVMLFCGGFIVFVIVSLINALRHHATVSAAPIAVGMAIVAGWLGYRLAALSFSTSGQELVIHNYFRTRRVRAGDIRQFDLGRDSAGRYRTVVVVTSDRSIPIDILVLGAYGLGRREGRQHAEQERLDPHLRALREWRDTAMIH